MALVTQSEAARILGIKPPSVHAAVARGRLKIVLDEKVNFPYLFPISDVNIDEYRRSLFFILWEAVQEGRLQAYSDSYFTERSSIDIVKGALVYEAIAIVLIAAAIVILRLRHSDKLGLKKKKNK